MFGRQSGNRLQLDDYIPETDEIGLVELFQRPALVGKAQSGLFLEGDARVLELEGQSLLVDRLQKPGAQRVVDLETGSADGICFR